VVVVVVVVVETGVGVVTLAVVAVVVFREIDGVGSGGIVWNPRPHGNMSPPCPTRNRRKTMNIKT